jgi:hypothetical protein
MLLDHFNRVKDGANNVYNLHNLSAFVEKNIYLEGKKYTFGDKYGFQKHIINDTERVTNVVKIAQIGMTTATMAYLLAAVSTQPRFNAIYALPTASDANKLTVTKLNPLINDSPEVRRLVDVDVNNNELKKFGNNFVFIRGSKSETAALSISADCLVADEIDRCDPDTLRQFRSRLQASNLQIIKQFSTPTVQGLGISKEAETSKRHLHMATCSHCKHTWLPSYHTDIIVPGFDGSLEEINKTNIKDVAWKDSRWNCPNCGKDPELHPDRLQWVCENPSDSYDANTYYVSPVTACLVLRPSYLVRTSTEFNTRSEWKNQVLGETSEEQDEQLTLQDIERAELQGNFTSSNVHYLGCDMGLLCSAAVGRLTETGEMLVVHREEIPITMFKQRVAELKREYKIANSVFDTFPYVPTITEMCDNDPNAYGAIFTTGKSPELFTLQEKEENKEEGKLNLRLLKVNRTAGMDSIKDMFKKGKVILAECKLSPKAKPQYLSLKRVSKFINDELTYVYDKTDGQDHAHFALLYLHLAIQLRGKAAGWTQVGAVPLLKKFRLKQ